MSNTNQPVWKLVANLGDVNPLEYGGYFVYTDETGVYEAQAELLIVEDLLDGRDQKYTVYRFPLDRCTLVNGILSDNKFHPECMAWFGYRDKDRPQDSDLGDVAKYADLPDIAELLCSENPVDRARAYQAIGDYHGWDNLDSYPLTLTRAEAEERYSTELKGEMG